MIDEVVLSLYDEGATVPIGAWFIVSTGIRHDGGNADGQA